MDTKTLLFLGLAGVLVVYGIAIVRGGLERPSLLQTVIGFVTWPRPKIQIGMGLALIIAAALMLMTALDLFPRGGDMFGLSGMRLAIAIVGNVVLGALMMLGIGLYAPCMILVYLLGMAPTAAFPIMMGSCAFLMPFSSVRFVASGTYHRRAALGLALGGLPAAIIAATLVTWLPPGAVRWLVAAVVVYTGINMLVTARVDAADPMYA
jgi:hypothetical protein